MARPKNKIIRKNLNTTLEVNILEKLRDLSNETGIPVNKIIELSLEKTLDKIRIELE